MTGFPVLQIVVLICNAIRGKACCCVVCNPFAQCCVQKMKVLCSVSNSLRLDQWPFCGGVPKSTVIGIRK